MPACLLVREAFGGARLFNTCMRQIRDGGDILLDLSRDADICVVEAQFFDRSVPQHLGYATFRSHADRCSAKRIILTHFGPDMLAHLPEAENEVAADGNVFEV